MTVRKPLVMVAGEIQQLQSTDSISLPEYLQLTADSTLIAGQAVYASAADHVDKAKADAAATSKCCGLAAAAVTSGQSGSIQNGGVIALTTGQWDAVAGTTGGLTFNTKYYLSATTAGLLTATAPSTVGQYVKAIGIAISTTELQLYNDSREILL